LVFAQQIPVVFSREPLFTWPPETGWVVRRKPNQNRIAMHRTRILTLSLALAAGFTAFTPVGMAAEKPKYTISEVMKALHKGDDSVGKRVSKGMGTAEDFAKLVEYYESLPGNKPSIGEADSWKEKSTALLKAAKGLKAGEAGALEAFKKASNCKACHSVHKEDK
jgi:hypothetical protein